MPIADHVRFFSSMVQRVERVQMDEGRRDTGKMLSHAMTCPGCRDNRDCLKAKGFIWHAVQRHPGRVSIEGSLAATTVIETT